MFENKRMPIVYCGGTIHTTGWACVSLAVVSDINISDINISSSQSVRQVGGR